MTTTFSYGRVQGTSVSGAVPNELLCGEYDLFLTASSWDSRCISIVTATEVRAKKSILLLFDVRDTVGLRDRHDVVLQDFCKKASSELLTIAGASTDVRKMWQSILQVVEKEYCQSQRPLRVLIDLSTCPRYYVLAVLAMTLPRGLTRQISFFYAEGRYPDTPGEESVTEIFTLGKWKMIPIPGLEGEYSPAKSRYFFISVGFEGAKIWRVVNRAEPDRISLMFPNPGSIPGYVERTTKSNEALVREYRIPPEQILNCPAGDAIAAWKVLRRHGLERPETENTYYLCCGTKPHSLALALNSMSLAYPAVLYNLPEDHKVARTEATGVFWRYDVVDLSAF